MKKFLIIAGVILLLGALGAGYYFSSSTTSLQGKFSTSAPTSTTTVVSTTETSSVDNVYYSSMSSKELANAAEEQMKLAEKYMEVAKKAESTAKSAVSNKNATKLATAQTNASEAAANAIIAVNTADTISTEAASKEDTAQAAFYELQETSDKYEDETNELFDVYWAAWENTDERDFYDDTYDFIEPVDTTGLKATYDYVRAWAKFSSSYSLDAYKENQTNIIWYEEQETLFLAQKEIFEDLFVEIQDCEDESNGDQNKIYDCLYNYLIANDLNPDLNNIAYELEKLDVWSPISVPIEQEVASMNAYIKLYKLYEPYIDAKDVYENYLASTEYIDAEEDRDSAVEYADSAASYTSSAKSYSDEATTYSNKASRYAISISTSSGPSTIK